MSQAIHTDFDSKLCIQILIPVYRSEVVCSYCSSRVVNGMALMRPLVLEQHHQYCPLNKHLLLQLAPRALSGGNLLVISLWTSRAQKTVSLGLSVRLPDLESRHCLLLVG